MRQLIGGTPLMIQALEPGTVGGQGAPAVNGNALDKSIHGHIEPDRHAVLVDHGAILRVRKRPSACRHHKVTGIDLLEKDRVLDSPEIRLPMASEDLRHRKALTLLDQFVDIHVPPVEASCQRARHTRLAGGHEADEIDFVGSHTCPNAPSLSDDATKRSSVSKNPGYETSTAFAPVITDNRFAAMAAIANAIAIR